MFLEPVNVMSVCAHTDCLLSRKTHDPDRLLYSEMYTIIPIVIVVQFFAINPLFFVFFVMGHNRMAREWSVFCRSDHL